MKFVAFFVGQCLPLFATVGVGYLAWAGVRTLLQARRSAARRSARVQTLWSNWSLRHD